MMIEVTTQAELDAALAKNADAEVTLVKGSFRLVLTGAAAPLLIVLAAADLSVVARESSQPRVVARGSSQPRVEAWESSQPRVEAWESSQPRVVAWGSSQPRVEAWESSQPRVVARESSQPRVVAWGYSMLAVQGRVCGAAAETVSVTIEGAAKIEGGRQVVVRRETAQEWCDYYGVKVTDGVALLYKGVRTDFSSPHGADYTPGTIPVADDWDGGKRECGGGLHFSPTPRMTHEFIDNPAHYLACPVALADIAVHPDGTYPQKVKARGCAAPVYEVDEDGERIGPEPEAVAKPKRSRAKKAA
jgi:hypothetical protein